MAMNHNGYPVTPRMFTYYRCFIPLPYRLFVAQRTCQQDPTQFTRIRPRLLDL